MVNFLDGCLFHIDAVGHLSDDASALHLTGSRPRVEGRDFVNALALITAMVDALRPASSF